MYSVTEHIGLVDENVCLLDGARRDERPLLPLLLLLLLLVPGLQPVPRQSSHAHLILKKIIALLKVPSGQIRLD